MNAIPYWSSEPYVTKRLFTEVPIPRSDEALILMGGIGPDILIKPVTAPSAIRAGKYTKLLRIKTAVQTVSGEMRCYCKSQVYQFCIRYKANCHVHDPLAAMACQFPDLSIVAEEFYQNLFSIEAAHYEMQDVAVFQNELISKFQNRVQTESGLQIGPLRSVQVEIDEDYRKHLRTMRKDAENVEAEILRVKNAEELGKAPITTKNAMLRDVLDGKKSLDQVLQESKQRKLEDFGQLKTLLEQLNELRASGLIGETQYQDVATKQLGQLIAKQPVEQQADPEQLYAPDSGLSQNLCKHCIAV